MHKTWLVRVAAVMALLLVVLGAQAQTVPQGFTPAQALTVEVLNVYPHDTGAWTQGLLWHEGRLYESTGQEGQSTLREVDIESGEVLRSVPVTQAEIDLEVELPRADYFAEGLELVNGELLQLTWQAGVAFRYDPESFERVGFYEYEGEGWGLCSDGRYLYMSDSTQYLSIREMDDFSLIARLLVSVNGSTLNPNLLNELECVGDHIYANLWRTDFIVQLDKFTGNAVAIIDAAGLLTQEMIAEIPGARETADGTLAPPPGAVLNGIAYNPESDTFYITGKYWPRLFEVRFVPAE